MLGLLSSVITVLVRTRVNAAITIQLFSELFYFINMSLFNRLMSRDSPLCTRAVGQRMLNKLRHLENWAEKQGLELAAECHLAKIVDVSFKLIYYRFISLGIICLSYCCMFNEDPVAEWQEGAHLSINAQNVWV